jgi:hypothetical protein
VDTWGAIQYRNTSSTLPLDDIQMKSHGDEKVANLDVSMKARACELEDRRDY